MKQSGARFLEVPLVWASALLTGLVSVAVLCGRWTNNTFLAGLGFHETSVSGIIAFLLIAMAVGMILSALHKLAVAMSLATLVAAVSVLELLRANGSFPAMFYPASLETAPVNASISAIIFSASLLIASRKRVSPEHIAVAFVLGLIGLVVPVLALYGYATGSKAAYSWASRSLPPGTALLLFTVGTGLCRLCWARYRSPGARLAEVLRGIQFIGGSVVLITVVLSACFAVLPVLDGPDGSRDSLTSIAVSLSLLVIVASGFLYILIGKLVRQISFLESKLKHSLLTVEEELNLRKQAQIEAEGSLREKEILLREVHHRVKNNLQIVSSILNLHLRREGSRKVASALLESVNRIQSIAILHETLYRTSNFSNINLEQYLSELAGNIQGSYDLPRRLKISIDAHGLTLDMDRVIPIGLILTELFTNSLKYAFPVAKPAAVIRIMIAPLAGGAMLFSYADNGVGFPPGFTAAESASLGWRLILMLVAQLRGEVNIVPGEGAQVEIHIPPQKSEMERVSLVAEEKYDEAQNSNSGR